VKTNVILILVFVAIAIMPATTKAENPTAVATTANVTTAGDTLYSFTVTYADDGEIAVGTLDNNDVRVTGPGGFDVAAAFVGVNINPAKFETSNVRRVGNRHPERRRGILPQSLKVTSTESLDLRSG
jgi:hypothetical protein